MPSQHPLQCPWCEDDHEDADSFRVHLMVEHRKSELAAFIERRVVEDPSRELVAR